MTERPQSDPAEHAVDFCQRHPEEMDIVIGQVMIDLGLTDHQMGARDPDRNSEHHVFFPNETTGGSISVTGQVTLDSGLLNTDLLSAAYHQDVVERWRRTRIKDRAQAMIAHEIAEHETGSHEGALKAAPDTELPISHAARELLRSMESGWKGRG